VAGQAGQGGDLMLGMCMAVSGEWVECRQFVRQFVFGVC